MGLRNVIMKLLAIFVLIFQLCSALYEDQIGKFDWRQQYIGKIKFAHIDPVLAGTHKFHIATEDNVLACLSTRTGSIIWRQVLEKGAMGTIDAVSEEGDIITVSGKGQYIRSWDPHNGVLQWETSFPNIQTNNDAILKFHINSERKEIVLVEMHPKSHAQVSIYSFTRASMKTSGVIKATWIQTTVNCKFISKNYFLCVDDKKETLNLLSLKDGGSFITVPLKNFGIEITADLSVMNIFAVPYQLTSEKPFFALQLDNDFVLFHIQPPGIKLQKIFPKVCMLSSTIIDNVLVLFTITQSEDGYKVFANDPESGDEISYLQGKFVLPPHHGNTELLYILPYIKKDQGASYKLMLSTEDHAILIIHQQGRMVWSREEALASIVSAEILDLPLSETEANIEQEFGDTNAGLVTMLLMRLKSQAYLFQTFLQQSLAEFQPSTKGYIGDSEINLFRDTFGLHKVIVVVTFPGKVFGIDNLSGQIVWSHFEPNLLPMIQNDKPNFPFFVQRTTAHFPYPPQCTVLGQHKNSQNTHLYSFDPITGKTIDSKMLSYSIMQALPMGVSDSHHLRGILLLDSSLKIYVYPDSSQSVLEEYIDSHFLITTDRKSGTVTGYSLSLLSEHSIYATEVWQVQLPQNIVCVSLKRPLEHVHSQGRVMGDRSVLYKYLNPNLAAIFTEGNDPAQKNFCNIYLIDTITGLIVYSATHKKCKSPIKVVHSENWVVYSYYNDKSRRVEISSIELFEGMSQSNTTSFSSFSPPPLPLVEHQTFIFPSSVETMIDTVTERGMTNKHILIALPTGGILELPKAFLDPRRPINPLPEHREEGLIPYIPELPIMSEGIINYNQSVMHINGIQTAPSGLESTCLVFAYGLDLYYTRVTPSKTFDILKDDFDHYLISAVLLGLLLLSYTTKKLAARKSLRAAWK